MKVSTKINIKVETNSKKCNSFCLLVRTLFLARTISADTQQLKEINGELKPSRNSLSVVEIQAPSGEYTIVKLIKVIINIIIILVYQDKNFFEASSKSKKRFKKIILSIYE